MMKIINENLDIVVGSIGCGTATIVYYREDEGVQDTTNIEIFLFPAAYLANGHRNIGDYRTTISLTTTRDYQQQAENEIRTLVSNALPNRRGQIHFVIRKSVSELSLNNNTKIQIVTDYNSENYKRFAILPDEQQLVFGIQDSDEVIVDYIQRHHTEKD